MPRLIALLLPLFLLTACATAPDNLPDRECAVTTAVLSPILGAAAESGDSAELARRTGLWPEAGSDRWAYVQQMGFSPTWRSGATDQALRSVYWRAYSPLQRDVGLSRVEREMRAWEAAYEEVGDDRLYADAALWSAFLADNQSRRATPCAQALAEQYGAQQVRASAPRAAKAVRIEPSRPVFSANSDRALIAARTVYPELNPGDGARVTGTVWLLNPRTDGSWRVISARRTDLQ
ncbi:hypothetical protein [Oceanicaulis sp. UBA2681]|uniref:hypothetical protein n=1 Tax=Oceanicaulis sp. UBA2681 TaxID=1947007 RepID=UPI000EE66625|nr:hypothetical protein [Oceanicaulis sp. UBA2681]HCR66445.1 hypothetical protein [Oceanicaulis sp.]|tara:strand:- start:159 stop:863 length:705 start_codon:yes stop_codon:yes gene_type:complete